jgi:anti-sigma-K factor RskA
MNLPSLPAPQGGEPELDSLLGAYALDALDAEERGRVEAYLARNPAARDEVDELRESAASLALAPPHDTVAPSELWTKISEQIAAEPREFTPIRATPRRAAPRTATVLAVAAAIAVVFLAASVVFVRGQDSSRPTDLAEAFDNAAKQSDARNVALAATNGDAVARVVVLPDGTGYLRNDAMQELGAGQTYQLWALQGDADKPVAISAGVLGADPGTVAFHTSGDIQGFGVTIEQVPGVVASKQSMYAQAALT